MKPSKNPKENNINNIFAESGMKLSNEEMEEITGGWSKVAAPRSTAKPGQERPFTSFDQAMAKPKENFTWDDIDGVIRETIRGDYIGWTKGGGRLF